MTGDQIGMYSDRQAHWQAGLLAGRLIDRQACRPAGSPHWQAGLLAGRLIDRQACWPAGSLTGRPVGQQAHWQAGLLAGRLTDRQACWPAGSLTTTGIYWPATACKSLAEPRILFQTVSPPPACSPWFSRWPPTRSEHKEKLKRLIWVKENLYVDFQKKLYLVD